MRESSTTPSILSWFDSEIVTPEMFTETWLGNDWARWVVAKSMALDLSGFNFILLIAQNQEEEVVPRSYVVARDS